MALGFRRKHAESGPGIDIVTDTAPSVDVRDVGIHPTSTRAELRTKLHMRLCGKEGLRSKRTCKQQTEVVTEAHGHPPPLQND
ncbi:hypothetical protein EVAR_79210_1 [Eumeta japonica]|uniref:Uncharacterized protein n=1 Tax=Eumeta variegata TaxID=151549 RepID=A0A4C1UT69_EUMVA|nr:hypothetical protein EVAR_79210_1 [Eumeta japonica]